MLIVIPTTLVCQTAKPDLIIANVELKYVKPNHIHKPGELVSGSDNLPFPRFFITVKNIGNREFSDSFYIVYANDELDFKRDHYSHLSIVNTDRFTIKSNDSLIVQVGASYGDFIYQAMVNL